MSCLKSNTMFALSAFILGLMITVNASAQATPLFCLTTNSPERKFNPYPIEYPCHRQYTNPSKMMNARKGACVFKSGTWQRGTVKWDDRLKKVVFIADFACERGIVISKIDQNHNYVGPGVMQEVYLRKSGLVTERGPSSWRSLVSADTGRLNVNEYPLMCAYHSAKLKSCARHPNEAGYCAFRNVNTANFSGYWWVQYTSANQGSFEVCRNGIRKSNLQNLANQNGKTYRAFTAKAMQNNATGTTGIFSDPAWIHALGKEPAKHIEPKIIAACIIRETVNGKLAPVRYACEGDTLHWNASVGEPKNLLPGRCYAYRETAASPWTVYYVKDMNDSPTPCSWVHRIEKTDYIPEITGEP